MHDVKVGGYEVKGVPDPRGRKADPERAAALFQRRDFDELPILLTTSEVAAIAAVDKRTIQRMCEAGELRACRFGRAWRINRDWLLRYTSAMAPVRGRKGRG